MRFNINILFGILFSLIVFLLCNVLIFSSNPSMGNALTILLMLFGGLALSILVKSKPTAVENVSSEHKKDLIHDISHDIIFAPQSLDIRLDKALHNLQKLLKSESMYVGIYEKRQIRILKQKQVSSAYLVDAFVSLENPNNDIEKIMIDFYKDKNSVNETYISINGEKYKTLSYPLVTKNSLKPFGIFTILYKKERRMTSQILDKMNFISEAISFTINMVYKKDELMKANINFYKKFNEIDEDLRIYNANKIQKTIRTEYERYKRYLTPLSVVFFEIDEIKNLSNILLNEEIIAVKKEFVDIVKLNIRATDIFGIWKENVFCVIAQNVDYQGANIMVKKFQSILQKHRFYKVNNISCSYGITGFSQKDTPELFQERAYEALLKAKDKGGNGIEIQLLV